MQRQVLVVRFDWPIVAQQVSLKGKKGETVNEDSKFLKVKLNSQSFVEKDNRLIPASGPDQSLSSDVSGSAIHESVDFFFFF